MWYNKTIQINAIASLLSEDEFSEIAKRIMRFMIVSHCAMHPVKYKDKQKIADKLHISNKKLLTGKAQKQNM